MAAKYWINRHRPGILVRLGWHRRIIPRHLDHAFHQDDALCILLVNEARQLDASLWRHLLVPLQIGYRIDPFECARRWCS